MLYRPYGRTGEQVSVISAGGMRFANPQDIDANAEVLLHAYRAGVNYFDTAPMYCADKSEEIVGSAVRQMKKGTFYVATKSNSEDPAKLRAEIERSLKRLGVERIDFFHIWCILSMEGWRKRAAALKAAQQARSEGLIRHLVVSTHLAGDEVGQMLEEGHFEGVTMGYSAINFPYRRQGVETARRMNLGVVAMNPLGGGLIPRNAERFAFLRSPADKSTTQAALRFVISTPGLTSALVGFTTKEHVDEAVAALDGFVPYGEEHFARLQEQILAAFDELCTGCGYCLPCPEGLAIPKLMDAYNQKLLNTGEGDHIGNRLKWHWGVPPESAGGCSLCGQCEDKCTQHLPIRERMKEIAAGAKKA
jgi:predicted aldo/keto reductase-like oxidoreductase